MTFGLWFALGAGALFSFSAAAQDVTLTRLDCSNGSNDPRRFSDTFADTETTKPFEQCFGWGKLIGPIRQEMVRGLDKVDPLLTLIMAAHNLTRLRSLANPCPQCAQ